ncbi:MAG: N-formylglutamate deformylase [Acetobacteraceae bacterium]|nr:N-formylglutamate deformylase [Acetobacteraceae bacterium]MDW8397413.1 N-formylglutamate deformylase [Acetobacteraceae bacterium]
MNHVLLRQGRSPLVLGMPHVGTAIPPEVSVALNDLGRSVPDTDWWLDRLYAPIAERFDATVIAAVQSRFVIDVNRDPSGASLYPGQNTTGLVPLTTFDGGPIWREEPDAAEIARRREAYFIPYHAALAGVLQATRIRCGHAVLWDCHSIRGTIPHLFDGPLPVLNLGTNAGASCSARVRAAAVARLSASPFTHVADGRFKGGWITRHYGQPARGIEALQMELAQHAYMDESPPWTFRPEKAARLSDTLADIIAAVLDAARETHA